MFRMHLLAIYAAIFVLSLYNVNAFSAFKWPKSVNAISWENCGPATDPIQVKAIDVSPDPIKVPGNFTMGFSSVDSAAVPADISISLTIAKKIAGIYVKLPCLQDWGSCTYTNVCPVWEKFCPIYFQQHGFPCTCPVPGGTYTLPDTVIAFTLKPPITLSGAFRIIANVTSSEYHVGCLQMELNLA